MSQGLLYERGKRARRARRISNELTRNQFAQELPLRLRLL
jgi:hypothetical protein